MNKFVVNIAQWGLLTLAMFSFRVMSNINAKVDVEASIAFFPPAFYEVKLQNKSSDFVCIWNTLFDTTYGSIILYNAKGDRVLTKSVSDRAYDIDLNFDFKVPYYILRPREKRSIPVDLLNFYVTEGKYKYKISSISTRCKDVVDVSRLAEKRNVKLLPIEGEGYIEVTKETLDFFKPPANTQTQSSSSSSAANEIRNLRNLGSE